MCAPGHAEWGVCLLLEQVVGLTDTRQTAVCDESCRVGGPGWGRDRARGQRGLVTGEGRDMEGRVTPTCGRSTDNGCEIHPCPPSSLSPSLPFLQPAWFLMVGGDRSFKLALTEKDEEFSDELIADCEVKGDR